MLGHPDWSGLSRTIGNKPASPFAVKTSKAEFDSNREIQSSILLSHFQEQGMTALHSETILLASNPSGRVRRESDRAPAVMVDNPLQRAEECFAAKEWPRFSEMIHACLSGEDARAAARAFDLLVLARDEDPYSAFNVAACHVLGLGTTKDVAQGAEILTELLGKQDFPVDLCAQVRLMRGDIHIGAHGGVPNPKQAISSYLEAGRYDSEGFYRAGQLAEETGDFEFAAQAYHRAAAVASVKACYRLAGLMIDGKTPGDVDIVKTLLELSASSGYPPAVEALEDMANIRSLMGERA
jgi:TPR repeat protein